VAPGNPHASPPAGRRRPAHRGGVRRDSGGSRADPGISGADPGISGADPGGSGADPGGSPPWGGSQGGIAPALIIDALGRKCPIPVIMLAERIRDVPVGQAVAVLADDPAAESDVPAWCMLKSHEFLTATDLPDDGGRAFLVRRSY
jgi:tRNA 2-thiouridine synthesizing protein A